MAKNPLNELSELGQAPITSVRLCSIEGCEKRHNARGFCRTHYERAKRNNEISVAPFSGMKRRNFGFGPYQPKECTKCGEIKPDDSRYFHWSKSDNRSDNKCKDCVNRERRDYRSINGDVVRAKEKAYWDARPEKRKEKQARNHAKECPERKRKYLKKYYRQNKEKWDIDGKARYRRLRSDPERMAKRRLSNRRFWTPEKVREHKAKRRAREMNAAGSFSSSDLKKKLKKQDGRCFYCLKSLKKYHADHFVPLARGGSNYASNIVIACPSCNRSKNSKMPWEWMPERFAQGDKPIYLPLISRG